MDIGPLLEIGLTRGEAQVYLSLLRLGTTKTGKLSANAQVSSSKVYKILDRLEQKGLVAHVIKQKIKHYTAVKPKRILDYLEEKEKEVIHQKTIAQQLIPELDLQINLAKQTDEIGVYEGFKGVMNLYRNILDELKKGESYCVIGAGYNEEIEGSKAFFQNYHTQRAKKGIHVNMLANANVKGKLVPSTRILAEIRYLPEYLMTKMSIIFYRDRAFLFLWFSYPKAFLIQSKEAVESFKAYFDAFWKIAKK